jgi:glycine oxidase
MADVAIAGAGLIGAGIAYELAKAGATVTVFDRDEPARAASWAGAGMLAPFSEELPDRAMLALCRTSLRMYAPFASELLERTGVDVKLAACGTLHVALDDASLARLHAAAPAYRTNGGDVTILDRAGVLEREASVSRGVIGGVFVANEAQVDNRRLGRALLAACEHLGVRFERSSELSIETDARRVRGVRTARGFVPANTVVNAAGAWAGGLAGVPEQARIPVVPIAGEMLAIAVPRSFARALIWFGHTYLVPRADGRLLVGATVVDRGFDARVTAGGVQALLDQALLAVPALGDFALVETWAGLRPGTPDKRPYLGATCIDGYFVAAGHYRNGILLTPATARALAQTIATGRTDVDLAAFSPNRAAPETTLAAANLPV